MSIAVRKREPVFIPDLSNATGYSLKNLPLAAGVTSILVVPLAGQDEILGALVVQSKAAGGLTSNTIGLMQTFAHQSVLAMQNARLFREIDQKGRELAKAHATVQSQAEKLKEQTAQLESWNLLASRALRSRRRGPGPGRQGRRPSRSAPPQTPWRKAPRAGEFQPESG